MSRLKSGYAKIPGIYMITVKPVNKIYIGESKDILKRFRQHTWMANALGKKKYAKSKNQLHKDIQKYGIQNVMLSILECGDKYKDEDYRAEREIALIAQYHADDPEIGYNEDEGGALGPVIPRRQSDIELLQRAYPIFLYNILLFYGGAKAIGKYFGFGPEKKYGKDIMSHNAIKGCLVMGRYYLIYANKLKRKDQVQRIYNEKIIKKSTTNRANVNKRNRYNSFIAVVHRVEELASEVYHFDV